MKKFFRVHNHFENMKEKVVTFSFKDKLDIWWEDLKNVKDISEEELSWKEFEGYYRKKYLSKRYFDSKSKDFHELKMGHMLNEEYNTKYLDSLRYVPYLKGEKEI